jgi:predicted HAD superfamily Cof-like phosphohydrolase
MTQSNFDMVAEFMRAGEQTVKLQPELADLATAALRIDLIKEETMELMDAVAKGDIVEIADALTDILYVTYGAGHAYGIDLNRCFAEVQRSNMSKFGPNGEVYKNSDGKVLKGPDYSKPDLKSVLGL